VLTKQITALVLLTFFSYSALAENDKTFMFVKNNIQLYKNSQTANYDEWIQVKNNKNKSTLSFIQDKKSIFGNEFGVAWNISDFISVNFNYFENQSLLSNNQTYNTKNTMIANKSLGYSKFLSTNNNFADSERISGYKFGLSSKLGLGRNYKLNINFDYGLMDGADLVGFDTNEINTSTFELGIRKNKFGASLNTDIFIEDSKEFNTNSRLGFELDWHFSDVTTLSFGSKQRINTSSFNNQSNSLESLTGNIQYIKFKHNL
jgi:hypothetical protein